MVNLILSNVLDYQAVLEQAFLNFLSLEGVSEKTRKNYRTDLRHFIGWSVTIIQTQQTTQPHDHQAFLNHLTQELLRAYRDHLIQTHIPAATINRRLSTLRIFFRCCQSHGWIKQNPAETLSNITQKQKVQLSHEELLSEFRTYLSREGASKATIRNYVSDARQFLAWLKRQEGQTKRSENNQL